MEPGEILTRMSIRKKIVAIVAVAVVITIILLAGTAAAIVSDNHRYADGKTFAFSAEKEGTEGNFL